LFNVRFKIRKHRKNEDIKRKNKKHSLKKKNATRYKFQLFTMAKHQKKPRYK